MNLHPNSASAGEPTGSASGQRTHEKAARDQLVTENVGLAKRIARKVGRRVDRSVRDDLEATALMGLVEAASRFDFGRTEPFSAFAYRRIRGAVLDGMRRSDFLPRRVRSLSKKANAAISRLEHELGRTPDDDEVAADLGLEVDAYQQKIASARKLAFVELGAESDVASDEDPLDRMAREQLCARVRAGLERLEQRDAQVLSLYYVEELTYSEIGRVFGVSEARICQLHARALTRLRDALD